MGTALKLASPRPLVNSLAAEISLRLETARTDPLLPEHQGLTQRQGGRAQQIDGGQVHTTATQTSTTMRGPGQGQPSFRTQLTQWENIDVLRT